MQVHLHITYAPASEETRTAHTTLGVPTAGNADAKPSLPQPPLRQQRQRWLPLRPPALHRQRPSALSHQRRRRQRRRRQQRHRCRLVPLVVVPSLLPLAMPLPLLSSVAPPSQ